MEFRSARWAKENSPRFIARVRWLPLKSSRDDRTPGSKEGFLSSLRDFGQGCRCSWPPGIGDDLGRSQRNNKERN
jgi:hypothetical protein